MRIAMVLVALCLLSVFCTPLRAQVTFQRTYGEGGHERGLCVRQTADGGYAVVGTNLYGMGNIWLIKTNDRGETLWTGSYGGTWEYDLGSWVEQVADGGYIVAGYTYCFGAGMVDAYLVRTDADGDTVWTRTYGGEHNDFCYSVRQTADRGFIVAGATVSFGAGDGDVWLIRTDSTGDTLWTRTYGDTLEDRAECVGQTLDSGFIICGSTMPLGSRRTDVFLIRTTANGDTLWTRALGGADTDRGYAVQQTRDSGFIAVGLTESFGAGQGDIWLIRTDAAGDTLWTRTYGGDSSEYSYPVSTQQTADGGYVIVGATRSFGAGRADAWLIKTDPAGDTLWTRTFGGDSWDCGYSVQQTSDGGFAITGSTESSGAGASDVWLIKTDPEGNVATTEPKKVIARSPTPGATAVHGYLYLPSSFYPAPSLLAIDGRRVAELEPGPNDLSHLAPGIYFCRSGATGSNGMQRLVLMR